MGRKRKSWTHYSHPGDFRITRAPWRNVQTCGRILLDGRVKGRVPDHHKGCGGNRLLDKIAGPVPSLDLVTRRLPDVRATTISEELIRRPRLPRFAMPGLRAWDFAVWPREFPISD